MAFPWVGESAHHTIGLPCTLKGVLAKQIRLMPLCAVHAAVLAPFGVGRALGPTLFEAFWLRPGLACKSMQVKVVPAN